MKILLVRLGALGDIVHALPVAAALRRRFPHAQIDWLVDVRHAALLDLVPVLDRRIAVDSRSLGSLLAVVRRLRTEGYTASVDLQGLVKSAALARLCGASRVAGFTRPHLREQSASFFYTQRVEPPAGGHVIDKNLSLLAALSIQVGQASRLPDDQRRLFPLAVPESTAVGEVRAEVARAGHRGYALINPGAAWPNKQWPPERFGGVARAAASVHGLLPVVLWGPGEEALAQLVVDASSGVAVLAPPTKVADIVALAHRARLMVSGDTGPLHLAGAVGTPLVAIFGPTDPVRNGPWHPSDISLSRFDDCVCHYRRRCRRSRACIEEISVEDVSGAIDRRLAAQPHA
jgi:heptosyltransferase I